eukprot:351705-Chlamydomonas_euryale.AAC.1
MDACGCAGPRRPLAHTCTAKSQMMTEFFASSHHISKMSREMPLCSPLGVAIITHGPTCRQSPPWRGSNKNA